MNKLSAFGLILITIFIVSVFYACDSGGGGSDTTAPAITDIAVTVTETEATITWKTSENADSKVEYGATAAYGMEVTNASRVKTHSIQLTGLTAGTEYHYRVTSADKSGNETVSSDNTFTTDTDTGVTVNVSEMITAAAGGTVNDATTGSSLNIPAGALGMDTTIQIGTATGFPQDSDAFGDSIFLGPSGTVFQTPVALTISYNENDIPAGLLENELFLLLSDDDGQTWTELSTTIDEMANTLTAALSGFSLISRGGRVDTAPLAVTAITAETMESSPPDVTVAFLTSKLATGVVRYGTTNAYGLQAGDATLRTNHNIQLRGLSSNTQYFYQIDATDGRGNTTTSDGLTFTTVNTGDTIPPVISNIVVQDVSGSSPDVTVTYQTDELAICVVDYGETTDYGSQVTMGSYTTAHDLRLTLNYGTDYHARITATDESGNSAMSDDFTFTSKADTFPPVISGITVQNVGGGLPDVTVSYQTNELAQCTLQYGETTNFDYSITPPNFLTDFNFRLVIIEYDTDYVARITATDEAGNSIQSDDFSFSTLPDTTPPVISDIDEDIDKFSLSLSYKTDKLSLSYVNYGLTEAYGLSASASLTPALDHSVIIPGLTSGSTYNYEIVAVDDNDNTGSSGNRTFTTLEDDTNPPVISGLSIVPDYNKISFSFQTDEPARSRINYGLTASYGSTVTDDTLKTDHSIEVSGLMPVTMYHFKLSVWDASDNIASTGDGSTTTLEEPLDIQFTGTWVETFNIGAIPAEISGLHLPIDNQLTDGLKLRVYADLDATGISLSDGQDIQVFMTYPNNTTTALIYYVDSVDDPCTPGVDESLQYSGFYNRIFDIDSPPEVGTYTFSVMGPKINGSLQATATYSGAPIDPPSLVSPAADADVPPPAVFNWSAVTGATAYQLTAAPINSNYEMCGLPPGVFFGVPSIGETTVTADSSIVAGERYVWAVKAYDTLSKNSSISFRMFNATEPDTSVDLILQEGLNGYTGTRDTTIYQGSSGSTNYENHTNGGGDTFIAGRTNAGFTRRALLQFDLSSIPAGSTINSASLELTLARTHASSNTQTLYRMFSEWGEGTVDAGGNQGQGAMAEQDDSTWIYRFYGFGMWADPGAEGNYFSTATSTATAGGEGTSVVFSDAGLVQDIQNFVSEVYPNRGWLIKGDESVAQTTKAYHSSESSSVMKPKLTINYTAPSN